MPRRVKTWIIPAALSCIVALLWCFPKLWYATPSEDKILWFNERTEIEGSQFSEIPVGESAERMLVADRTVNGDFLFADKSVVRVFSAKRYEEKANEIGLFVHTPDRCWTEVGWQLEPTQPEVVNISLHGRTLTFERRIFRNKTHRELVYFGGLVGGESLPYRLDHNLSVGEKLQAGSRTSARGARLRALDSHYWKRLWDSFVSREELFGPKQFVRISTTIQSDDISAADQRLQEFLPRWLERSDYQSEKAHWKMAAAATGEK